MYLDDPAISRFEVLVRGFALGADDEYTWKVLGGFQQWVQERYGVTSTQSWAKIIRFNSLNESNGLDVCLKHFREFLASEEAPAAVSPPKEPNGQS